ncbi:Ubiquinone biosynthesis O-methyltransferase [Dyella sp. AD56]|uniref:class I SAM-dependent methyltransferase n=1 Tax=Dyella sp. AD56 TaxID=1528744 RepID=UPI000C85C356|nr:methyltransferase domain-containing protein [Dyella sp. AD56]PMQ02881.1 Ubiquinone biosynthesis O-methyltransferase [Dyella sp. AD56]
MLDTQVTPLTIADAFWERVKGIKDADRSVNWYPYDSLGNIDSLNPLLPDWISTGLVNGFNKERVLDIGPADGDLGYLFASRGCRIDFLDYPQTNYNDCRGIKTLGKTLKIKHGYISCDLDRGFALKGQYDLALCLGVIYHLRNPMLVLMELARHAQHMLLSTRVSTEFPDGADMGSYPCAYLLECRESNDDPTNYWSMSPFGLRRILKRSGWIVKSEVTYGPGKSNPIHQDADSRMFVYCERVPNWADLGKHHDF